MTVKRNFQDSLFRDIFSFPENQLKQYMAFHPEDTTVTVDDITNVTLESILVKDMYNDLGFWVRNQLIVLFEAQSTSSPNIMVRELMYFSKTLENYIYDKRIDIYSSAAAPIPKPELYMVYSGDRESIPDTLSLADIFWNGDDRFLEVHVKVIASKGDDIIGQYLQLVSALKEAIHSKEPGKALRKAIDDCIEKGILADYLKIRKKEVIEYMLKILEDDYINEAHDKTVADTNYKKGVENSIKLLASSYRKKDPALSVEESLNMAAGLLDPEHIVSIEEMISDISAQENASEKY